MIRASATLDAADEYCSLTLTGKPPITSVKIFLKNTSMTTGVFKVRGMPSGGTDWVNLGWINLNTFGMTSGGNFSATDSTDYIIAIPDVGGYTQVQVYLVSVVSGSYAATVLGLSAEEAADQEYSFPTALAGTAQTITSTSATALAVGANGTTNPVFSVNANTASVATGLTVIGAAAAGGVALKVLSSGTDEALNVSAKGSGNIVMNATGTGITLMTTGITMADATNIVVNATTGSKIGTATTQKLGFFNATPVVQPVANTDTTTGAAGGTTAIYLNTTFTGAGGTAAFTVGGVITKLKALGLLAA